MASFLPADIWSQKIIDLLGLRDRDRARLVSRMFRRAVARLRASPGHGALLLGSAMRHAAATVCEKHKGCVNFSEPGARLSVSRSFMGAYVQGLDVHYSTPALLLAGARMYVEWPDAPRAIAWALRRLDPVLYRYLWHSEVPRAPAGDGAPAEHATLAKIVEEMHVRRWGSATFAAIRTEVQPMGAYVFRACDILGVSPVELSMRSGLSARAAAVTAHVREPPAATLSRLFSKEYRFASVADLRATAALAVTEEARQRHEEQVLWARHNEALGTTGPRDEVDFYNYSCSCGRIAAAVEAGRQQARDNPIILEGLTEDEFAESLRLRLRALVAAGTDFDALDILPEPIDAEGVFAVPDAEGGDSESDSESGSDSDIGGNSEDTEVGGDEDYAGQDLHPETLPGNSGDAAW